MKHKKFEMERYAKHPAQHANYWVGLDSSTRRARAVKAAASYDYPTLCGLITGFLTLYPTNGGVLAHNTMRGYKAGCRTFVRYARNHSISLLSSEPTIGETYRLHLESVRPHADPDRRMVSGTIDQRLQAARVLFKALEWARAARQNPFLGIRAVRDRTKPWDKRQPYPQADIETLLKMGTREEQLLILLGAHAGLRISETLVLRPTDINFTFKHLTVRNGKGGKQRKVRLTPPLIEALRHQIEEHVAQNLGPEDVLFEFTSDDSILVRIKRLCKRADVPYLGYHSFRHSCGTAVYEQKGLEAAKAHLGHEQLATTSIYAKWSDKRVRQVLGTW